MHTCAHTLTYVHPQLCIWLKICFIISKANVASLWNFRCSKISMPGHLFQLFLEQRYPKHTMSLYEPHLKRFKSLFSEDFSGMAVVCWYSEGIWSVGNFLANITFKSASSVSKLCLLPPIPPASLADLGLTVLMQTHASVLTFFSCPVTPNTCVFPVLQRALHTGHELGFTLVWHFATS